MLEATENWFLEIAYLWEHSRVKDLRQSQTMSVMFFF